MPPCNHSNHVGNYALKRAFKKGWNLRIKMELRKQGMVSQQQDEFVDHPSRGPCLSNISFSYLISEVYYIHGLYKQGIANSNIK